MMMMKDGVNVQIMDERWFLCSLGLHVHALCVSKDVVYRVPCIFLFCLSEHVVFLLNMPCASSYS